MRTAAVIFFTWFMSAILLAHPVAQIRFDGISQDITQNPDKAVLYLQRGDLHRSLGEFSSAALDFETALSYGANEDSYLYHKGLLLRDQGEKENAEALFEKAMKLSDVSNNTDLIALLHLSLAEIHSTKQNWLMSAEHYEQVINTAKVTDSSIYQMAATQYLRSGSEHSKKALNIIDLGLAKNKGHLCFNKTAIQIELQLLNFKSAYQRLSELVQKQPRLLSKGVSFSELNCMLSKNKKS